jgi:hypothetical protein
MFYQEAMTVGHAKLFPKDAPPLEEIESRNVLAKVLVYLIWNFSGQSSSFTRSCYEVTMRLQTRTSIPMDPQTRTSELVDPNLHTRTRGPVYPHTRTPELPSHCSKTSFAVKHITILRPRLDILNFRGRPASYS